MTADVNVNGSTTEVEDKCGLDMSGYEDLPIPAADCNGVENGNKSEKGNREDVPDASYVFVGGNGAVVGEPAATADLNGRSNSIENFDSGDVKVEYGTAELVVDHGDEDVKNSVVERDAGSPLKDEVILNDENGGENGSVEVPNGTEDTVQAEVYCLDDHGEVEVEHDKLASNTVKGTKELEVNVPGTVDSENKPLQFDHGDEKAEVLDNMESTVPQESRVADSTDIIDSEPSKSDNIEVASSNNITESKQILSGEAEFTRSGKSIVAQESQVADNDDITESERSQSDDAEVASSESEQNQSGKAEDTRSGDIAEQNQSGNIDVTSMINIAELELNQSGNNENMVEGEIKLDLVSTMQENQDSPIIITDGLQTDNSLDLDQCKEPVASEVELLQNIEGTACLVERAEVVDSSLSDEYGNGMLAGCAGDNSHGCQPTIEKDEPPEGLEPVLDGNYHGSDAILEAVHVDEKEIHETGTETAKEKLDANSSENVNSNALRDREVARFDMVSLAIDEKPEPETDAKDAEFSPAAYVGSIPVSLKEQDSELCAHGSVQVQDPVDVIVSRAVPHDGGHASEPEVLDGSVSTSEGGTKHIQKDLTLENKGSPLVSIDSDEKTDQEIDVADGENKGEASTSIPEGSAVGAFDEQNLMVELGKSPFFYMIRIPRYDDCENLKEQIKHAQNQVDEKTKSRDAIRAEMHKQRVKCNEYAASVDAAILEEIAARDLLKSKRKEMDSLMSVINKVKSIQDVGEIDGKIHNMEHMIQHETLPLKEEKSYIRSIQQLKQNRERLSSKLGKQEDLQEAVNQKEEVEKGLKSLRKEADLLRENVPKAEGATKNAKKKYQDEHAKLNALTMQFKAADDVRQQAYADLQYLRKQLYEKNKHFFKYKDDANAAYDLATKGDKEELQSHCVNQVDRVMELWNNNDEFRKEYIRSNMRSTLRRLRTLDGRSLGPDEATPVFPIVSEKVANDNAIPSFPPLKEEKTVASKQRELKHDKSPPKVGDQINPIVKDKKPAKGTLENGSVPVSVRNEMEEAGQPDENKITREEEELIRKATELKKEEEAAMLKEQRRLEEKAKAKQAMERKKRIAEKAQSRAAVRAQKEAEQKEKEREKKARKKERRKAVEEDVRVVEEGESSPSVKNQPENKDSEMGEKPVNETKRSRKPSHFTKQTKLKSPPVPVPLRNRSKRRTQTWICVLVTALVIFCLFLFGNGSFSLQRFGF